MFHVVPNCRAIPLMEARSRRIWLIAHQHALVVRNARRSDVGFLIGEHYGRARGSFAAPGPLAPHQLHRPVKARRVDQGDVAAAVAMGDHAATPQPIGERSDSTTMMSNPTS